MALTDLKIQSVKATSKPQKIADGEGMYLFVSASGSKAWRFDYGYGGKRFTYTIGKYPAITLAAARARRAELKAKLRDGLNISVERKTQKILARSKVTDTFASIADDWYKAKVENRSVAWRIGHELYLRRDLLPKIGGLPIQDVSGPIFTAMLELCAEKYGLKTADRVRQTALQVFEHAILKFKTKENPAKALRKWAEIPPVSHRPHLLENQLGELIEAIDAYPGYLTTKLAAKLLLLTFVRKTEVTEARWMEVDTVNAIWIIPAARMKMKSDHFVPLSKQALETLNELRIHARDSEFVFPKSSTLLRPISRTALNNMFSKMARGKYKGVFSPHGIRGTASTWANEGGRFRSDVIERQLAHTERNNVRAAYNHAEYLPERRQLMQAWADFLFPSIKKD
jgi:integrase